MVDRESRAPLARRATMKDVARIAGVSQSTASRALSGEGYVAAGVRDRVLLVADELGYVPHAMASSLRKQVSRSVGVLVSDLRNSFYAELAAGIGARARSRGYTMMLADDRGLEEEEIDAARAFVATRVAGVIVTPLSAEVSGYLLRQHIPVVEVDRQFAQGACDAVVIDNVTAARRMTEHLISLGHRRVALVIDETDWTTGRERFRGYREALTESGIPVDPTLVVSTGWDVGDARSAAAELLSRSDRPTAVFAANNILAEGLWRAAAEGQLRIPTDLSVVSFDDAPWMSMVTPAVTAIAQDAVALGEAAFDRMVERIESPSSPVRTVVLNSQIRSRQSTAAPEQSAGAAEG